ncbi:MAG: hypothetical protein M3Q44_04075 [bacterium]|nr:hypothetical protein [bacterium]
MAQRQFRSDDTSIWAEGWGDGSDNDLDITANTTDASIASRCSGAVANNANPYVATPAGNESSFTVGKPVKIRQMRGTGAAEAITWEYNVTLSIDTVNHRLYLKYPLTRDFNDNGGDNAAQIIQLKQYRSVTIRNGASWYPRAWDGNIGGDLPYLCLTATNIGTASQQGYVDCRNRGFRGGVNENGAGQQAMQGEGHYSGGTRSTASNGNGGGGAFESSGGPSGSTGGGGANANNGGNGTANGSGVGGSGGVAAGTADLRGAVLAGAGGGSAEYTGNNGAQGATAPADFSPCSKEFYVHNTNGAVYGDGSNSSTGNLGYGSGASAGFNFLLKCQRGDIGTNRVSANVGVGAGSGSTKGGDGSIGRGHTDYGQIFNGSINGVTINTRQDSILNDRAGGLLLATL